MLSKVAERVYWTARYFERVESTARMIGIYDLLLFDLPRDVKLTWYNLILINDQEHEFGAKYSVQDERNVIKFMVGDTSNPFSVVSSLQAIRENVRTTRDVIDKNVWELTNELSLYVQENLQQGINRSNRHAFLENIIRGCQQILGLLYGNMPHNAAWSFLQLGLNIERADMTSRNLETAIAAILDMEGEQSAVNSHQIIWGHVLRSLNADQPYRRTTRMSVKGDAVVDYLIEDEAFPRSIKHCLNVLESSCKTLPSPKIVLDELEKVNKQIFSERDYEVLDSSFKDYLNRVQINMATIHQLISETWFSAK